MLKQFKKCDILLLYEELVYLNYPLITKVARLVKLVLELERIWWRFFKSRFKNFEWHEAEFLFAEGKCEKIQRVQKKKMWEYLN